VLEDPFVDDHRQAAEALVTASAIPQERGRPLLEEEADHLGDQIDVASQFVERMVAAIEEDGDDDLAGVLGLFTPTFDRVHAELTQAPDGLTVAVETLEPASDLTQNTFVAQLVLMERGIARRQFGPMDGAKPESPPVLEA
jgi:hypothetical protein